MGYIPIVLSLLGFIFLAGLVNKNSFKVKFANIIALKQQIDNLAKDLAIAKINELNFFKPDNQLPSTVEVDELINQVEALPEDKVEIQRLKDLAKAYRLAVKRYNHNSKGIPSRWFLAVFPYPAKI
ncbi:MAG: hypothetical protein LAT68_15340 [Cyclobacteriaceae bacterium]|nr:hypothetical protein [Cyclobacteriaceae bacterium]MCH8517695.1 hypothetical protein [Cyclobacteriaceae bacterium]